MNLRLVAGLSIALMLPQSGWCWDREGAKRSFEKASEEHRRLRAVEADKRPAAQYRRVIKLYRFVLDKDPSYSGCDDSLSAIAGLYEELWRRFAGERDRERAVYYYQFLAAEYPASRYRTEALERAKPLKEAAPSRGSPQAAAARTSGKPANDGKSPPPAATPARPAVLSAIKYWSTDDYTRVVLVLDREVQLRRQVLSSPDRLAIYLPSTRLKSPELARTYSVNDVFIKQIRVGEHPQNEVRVVLDYEKITKHQVFVLYNPYRLVIDTLGEEGRRAADQSEKPQRSATAEAVIPLEPAKTPGASSGAAPTLPSPTLKGDLSLTRVLGLKVGRVVLDPGHGGADTGCIGPGGLREKNLVLDVALRLKTLLEERLATEVVMTRNGDEFVPLEDRTAIANQRGADLFVSIHANSSRSRRVSGVETYYLSLTSSADEREVASRENAGSQKNIHELEELLRKIALRDFRTESAEFAAQIQTNVFAEMKPHRPRQKNRGVRKAPFIVLIGANMPAVLAEIGFISNPSDEKYFKQEKAKTVLAEALYKGIDQYFRSLGGDAVRAAAGESRPAP
jgi:N-acetylmuramoyl-L-alanine amidase